MLLGGFETFSEGCIRLLKGFCCRNVGEILFFVEEELGFGGLGEFMAAGLVSSWYSEGCWLVSLWSLFLQPMSQQSETKTLSFWIYGAKESNLRFSREPDSLIHCIQSE